MYRLAEETRRLVRDKNSAAAGTYFSNLSPFSFAGRWGDCGGWEQKGVCHFCHGGSRAASISALHPGCGGHAVSSGTEAFAFVLFKKKNCFGRMAFLQICPKTVKCQLMQTARRHLFMLTSLQVKGWYWDRKTSAKWDNSISSVYYRHQKENGGVHEFPVSDFLVHLCFDVLFTTIWFLIS